MIGLPSSEAQLSNPLRDRRSRKIGGAEGFVEEHKEDERRFGLLEEEIFAELARLVLNKCSTKILSFRVDRTTLIDFKSDCDTPLDKATLKSEVRLCLVSRIGLEGSV